MVKSVYTSRAARRQGGAYTVLSLFVVTMALGALGVLAVGHTAWEKARLQGTADLVALTAARQMADGPGFAEARSLGQNNGVLPTDTLTIECLINGAVSDDCENAVTSRVSITRSVGALLPFLNNRSLSVLAEATAAPTVVGSVSSGLLALNTNQSALLNGLLSALGGGNVSLTVAQWGSLLGSSVQVDLLDLSAELGVLTLSDLLSLDVSALGLLEDALVVGNASEAEKMQVQGLLSLLSGPLNTVDVRVGDLIAADLSGRTDTPLTLQFGQLAQVALLNSVEGVGYSLPISSGLLNLDVGLTVLEAPQVFVGRKMPYKNPVATAKTSQVALDVRVRQPLNLVIPAVNLSALDMRVQLRVAGGLAEVNELACHYPRANNSMALTMVPALAEVCVAQSAANLNTTTGALTCGAPANILSVGLLGLVNAGVSLAAQASLRSDPVQTTLVGHAPLSQTVNLNVGQTLGNLLGNMNLNLQVNLPFVGPLISGVVNGLVNTLLTALNPVLRPVLTTVGNILDDLLEVVGVDLNTVTVNVDAMDCQSVVLSR
ncbi:hypothetical protein [Limnobacter sp.]|uniref:hypothetical protein n=1 Tax=Limnobacter sp. TaxID=2003368 RepID=UPI003511D5D0